MGCYNLAAMSDAEWTGISTLEARSYTCAYCGALVVSENGFGEEEPGGGVGGSHLIYICPNGHPTYFDHGEQIPAPAFGDEVAALPPDVKVLYNEARVCMMVNAHTAAVMACRKLLMNVAVEKGAPEGESYKQYVDYLDNQGYVPPGSKDWVDRIRDKGNDANHEIVAMSRSDAEELITFVEMLLKIIYEFPSKATAKSGSTKS